MHPCRESKAATLSGSSRAWEAARPSPPSFLGNRDDRAKANLLKSVHMVIYHSREAAHLQEDFSVPQATAHEIKQDVVTHKGDKDNLFLRKRDFHFLVASHATGSFCPCWHVDTNTHSHAHAPFVSLSHTTHPDLASEKLKTQLPSTEPSLL